MMFSKLSVFVAATLVALTAAAGVPAKKTCPNGGPVECCLETRLATAADKALAAQKLGVTDLGVGVDSIWDKCSDLGNQCAGHTVCCDKLPSDRSIALKCTNA